MTPNLKIFALLGLAMAAISCAAPKAPVVAEEPVEKKQEKVPEPLVQEPEMPALPSDDSPRLPGQMLDLPSDGDFRPSNPVLPKVGAGGVVIRPPTDPPSRVKPKDPAPE
ncbi:MAG: hypothetical protein ABIS50_20955 [Luteolibacter sp.]|uniref:hypothetical protein n=1 Tax=Luteolibacter sp. TaxID=1962973 RepID=UPI003265C1CA